MRPTQSPPSVDAAYLRQLVEVATRHDISHVGVCNAEILERARAELLRRKEAGLHDGLPIRWEVENGTGHGFEIEVVGTDGRVWKSQ